MNTLPSIGASGIYDLESPFDSLINPSQNYTTIAVRRFTDFIEKGENPKELFYDPHSLDLRWRTDKNNPNAAIVTLRASSGEMIYVPSSFIKSFPDSGGVLYSNRIIGVSLGAIPQDENIDNAIQAIKEAVEDTLGIDPEVRTIIASEAELIGYTAHENVSEARWVKMSESDTLKSQLLEAKTTIQNQVEVINILNQYIKDNL